MPEGMPADRGRGRVRWFWGASRRGLIAAALALACGVAGCGSGAPVAGQPRAALATKTPGAYAGKATPSPAIAVPNGTGHQQVLTLAPHGIRSSWVEAENAKPGSRAWRITGAPAAGYIRGFADRTYAADGQAVVLRVSTSAPSYHITAYRIGWYGGAGARAVWRSTTMPGQVQPACTLTGAVNMVSCENWRASVSVRLTDAFVPGDYLFKLVGQGGQQSYIPLTVWDPTSRATYLVKNDVFTWQAWNTYGGYDYYLGQGTCPTGVYPLCSRARVVSFDRPYDSHGAGNFLTLEAPLVRFLERRGLDVTYATDVTVAQHPRILQRHRAMLSLGHDECWSLRERLAAVAAERHGTNIAFFGASAMLRHVRPESSRLGRARQLVDYRDSSADPMDSRGRPRQVTGNTWSDPPASWPENDFVGEDYNGFLEPGVRAPLTVTDANSWAFRGTGLQNGAQLPGVIASDVDSLEPGLGHPAGVHVLAHSPLPTTYAQAVSQSGGAFYSDMTYYTDPHSRARVWDSGTNNWIPALEAGHGESTAAAAAVQQITDNVLRRLGR